MISVIVPIYNAEKYLHKCIDSILNQTYTNFELILVDDGSKDNSADICDKFAMLDFRIKVIHQKNGGEANARNTGLKKSIGEYIAFVDSDDYVDIDYLKYMKELEEKYQADFVSCQCEYLQNNGSTRFHHKSPKKEMEIIINLDKADYSSWYLSGGVWCRLYKKEVIDKFNLMFDSSFRIGCDFVFNMQYLSHSQISTATSKCLYTYVQQDESIMNTVNNEAWITGIYATEAGRKAVINHTQLSNQINYINLIRIIEYLQRSDVKKSISKNQRDEMMIFVKTHIKGQVVDFKLRLYLKKNFLLLNRFLKKFFEYDILRKYRQI